MFNNIGGSSAAPHSYYSETNDQAPSSYDAPYESRRSSNDPFSSLAPRRDAVSEFGSVVSQELLGDYHAPYFHNPSVYTQWSTGGRPRSDSSAGSFASADDRSFSDRASADSGTLPPSSASTSTVSSLHPLSDIGQALSEAGSGHSSGGHLSSHSSDKSSRSSTSLSRHQNRLPSVSDGSAQRSLTDRELDAIRAARDGGRFFPGQSELGSAASGVGYEGGGFSRRGTTHSPGNRTSGMHTIAENLSDAGGSVSPERAELLERLNRAREGFSIPSDHPSVSWQPDTDLTVDDIHLSTPVTAGPPSRRPPPAPLRRRSSEIDSQSDASAAPSRFRPVSSRVHGPAIYGRQPALSRAWNALTNRRR